MDISKDWINVEYYARDMKYEGMDLYPVECDLKPSYGFQITQKAIWDIQIHERKYKVRNYL